MLRDVFSTRRSPTTTGTDRARYKLDRQRVSYLGICTHLANARCHADISRSYNRRISSMEDVIIIERRTSRLHQRSRPSSSRSPRECHRSRTEHHPGKRRKSTGAFIFSCRLRDALLAKLQVGADDARGMAMHRIEQADLLLGHRVVWHHSSKVSITERGSREKRG